MRRKLMKLKTKEQKLAELEKWRGEITECEYETIKKEMGICNVYVV